MFLPTTLLVTPATLDLFDNPGAKLLRISVPIDMIQNFSQVNNHQKMVLILLTLNIGVYLGVMCSSQVTKNKENKEVKTIDRMNIIVTKQRKKFTGSYTEDEPNIGTKQNLRKIQTSS